MQQDRHLLLVLFILLFQFISYISGEIVSPQINDWYNGLMKSNLSPPGFIFGIVWTILYFILGIISFYLYELRKNKSARKIIRLFGFQILLNISWTPVFFGFHQILFALIILISINIANIYILFLAFKNKKFLFYAMLPYTIWCLFAAYLNWIILISNKGII